MKKQYGVKKIELVHYKIKALRKGIILLLVIIGLLCWYSVTLIEITNEYAEWSREDACFIEEYRATILELKNTEISMLRELEELEFEVARKDSLLYYGR